MGRNFTDKAALENFFSGIPVIPMDEIIIQKGIQLRQSSKMSLGDAITAATALNYDLEIWTHNITDFNFLDGIRLNDPLED